MNARASICLLVSGDFVQTGGMDIGNYMLARQLAERGWEVHLVAHRVAADLAALPGVHVHRVPKPLGLYLFGLPLLDRSGRRWAGRVVRAGGRVVVNGGNCRWGDVNWVHYVHAVYTPDVHGSLLRRWKARWQHRCFLADERRALGLARLVIANSHATKRVLVEKLGLPEERIRVVYYGIEPARLHPQTREERLSARAALGWAEDRLKAVFVGALGDRRKGFDLLVEAWGRLCADPGWDADLAVVGQGGELLEWQTRVVGNPALHGRVEFLGFRQDVPRILGAADLLVAPTRYEAYGLGVHEALCCGVPAMVSADAGVAERYPAGLQDLLLPTPLSVEVLVERLRLWRGTRAALTPTLHKLAAQLAADTWEKSAGEIVDAMLANP